MRKTVVVDAATSVSTPPPTPTDFERLLTKKYHPWQNKLFFSLATIISFQSIIFSTNVSLLLLEASDNYTTQNKLKHAHIGGTPNHLYFIAEEWHVNNPKDIPPFLQILQNTHSKRLGMRYGLRCDKVLPLSRFKSML